MQYHFNITSPSQPSFYLYLLDQRGIVEQIKHPIVGWHLAQSAIRVISPQICTSLTGKRIRDPAVLVIKVPDGHAHAARDIEARADRMHVVVHLRRNAGVRGRQRQEAHVKLCNSHVESERNKVVLGIGLRDARRRCAGDEVRLQANSVDAGARMSLDLLDESKGRILLRAPSDETLVSVYADQ